MEWNGARLVVRTAREARISALLAQEIGDQIDQQVHDSSRMLLRLQENSQDWHLRRRPPSAAAPLLAPSSRHDLAAARVTGLDRPAL